MPSATVARSRVGSFAGNTLRIRGFTPQQIRNGIFQRFYDGTDPSALSNVARIEVLKGPSGVLYGQSGVGGIISIITKQPTDSFEGSVALTGGMYNQKQASVDIGGPITDTLGIRLTGEIERSGSFTDHIDVDRENIGVALAWKPTPAISAHFVGEYLHRKLPNNPGLPTVGTVTSNGVGTVKRSTFLGEPDYNFQANHAPLLQAWVDFKLSGTWTLTPRVQYNEWNNTSRSTTLLPPAPGQPTLIQRVGRDGGEHDKFYVAQLDLAGEAIFFGIRHKLLFGVEYNHDDVPFRMQPTVACGVGSIDALMPVYGCGAPTGAFGFLADAKLEGYAFYAQDQIALTDAWNVVAGIRHSDSDNDNAFTTAFSSSTTSAKLKNTSWQLGTTYALGNGLSLFGGYNTGYDLGAVTGSRKFDGAAFEPETSNQAEAGVRLTRDNIRTSLSAFQIRRNNVGVPDPANLGFNLQDGQFRTRGVELEGEWSPLPGWWFRGTLYSRLDNKRDGAIVVIAQRLHTEDLGGVLREQGGWEILSLPAIAQIDQLVPLGAGRTHAFKTGDILHPEREPRETLDDLARTLGTYAFSAQYLQAPVPIDGGGIKWSWFSRYDDLPTGRGHYVQSWDIAVKDGPSNDYSVCTTWLVDGSSYYLVSIDRERLLFPDLLKRAAANARQYRPRSILIEDAGPGASLIQQLRADREAGIPQPIGCRPVGDKYSRMAAETPVIEAGQAYLPNAAAWLDEFRKEIVQFPSGRYDDQVDSMSQFLLWQRTSAQGGFRTMRMLGR